METKEKSLGEDLFNVLFSKREGFVPWDQHPPWHDTHVYYEALAQELFDLWRKKWA
jgi:hypothetical protein